MRIFLLGFTFFSVFGLLARYYAVQHIWQAADPTLTETPNGAHNTANRDNTLMLYYHDSLLLGGYETFALDANDALDLSTNNRVFLEQALRFLKQNPDKNLHITATFQRNETTDEYYETRGIARAAMLRDYLVHAGLPIERMSLNDAMTDTKPTFLFEIHDADTPVLRFDEKEMTFFDDNFLEHAATFRPKNSFTNYMNNARPYLNAHQNSHLSMTVYMDGNNQEKTEEFAISRAEAVKNHILALGLIAYKIKIDIKINDILVVKDNSYNATLKNHRVVLRIVE